MVIKKYKLNIRNLNANIITVILKTNDYNSIEEYEFETENNQFDFYIDSDTNHVAYFTKDKTQLNNSSDKYRFIYVPLSYLTDETKEYFYKKYIFKNGFDSFDEYFLSYSYSLPCIIVNIPLKKLSKNETNIKYMTTNQKLQIYMEQMLNQMHTLSEFQRQFQQIITHLELQIQKQTPFELQTQKEKETPFELQTQKEIETPFELQTQKEIETPFELQTHIYPDLNIDNEYLINIKQNIELIVDEPFSIKPFIDFKNLYCKRTNNKFMVRAFNIELDRSYRPQDYKNKTWFIFDTIIKYNRHYNAWVFPNIYKQKLVESGVLFI